MLYHRIRIVFHTPEREVDSFGNVWVWYPISLRAQREDKAPYEAHPPRRFVTRELKSWDRWLHSQRQHGAEVHVEDFRDQPPIELSPENGRI